MTDLTMGQRIAECRKKLGLSQEALGEKMGVSRQAISKWEADGAVPEIDKLIALSKLFEVSVGWLLGVEESREPQQQAEISEELLYKVEEIVKRYQPKKETEEKKLSWRIAELLFAFAAIAAIGILCLSNPKPTDYSSQIAGLESQVASLQSQISSLRGSITGAEAADSPISDYSFQVTPDTNEYQAHIAVTVIPKTWSEANTATLSVRREGSQVLNQACDWDGAGYTASIALPIEDGYEYWFITGYPDGTQEQTRLTDVTAEDIADSFLLVCEVQQGTGKFNLQTNTLELVNYEVYLEPPYRTIGTDVYLSSAELILYHIRGGVRQIADTYELFKPEDPASKNGQGEAISGIWCYPYGPFQIPEVQDGDGFELWVNAEMSNGISTFQLINSWAYSDGEFNAGQPVD